VHLNDKREADPECRLIKEGPQLVHLKQRDVEHRKETHGEEEATHKENTGG